MTVHPGSATSEQNRPINAEADRSLDGPAHGRRVDGHDLATLAAHPQHTVTMLLAKVVDVGAGGLEDPQPEKAEHRDQREVVPVRRSLAV